MVRSGGMKPTRVIEVSWIKGAAKGFTDLFPVERFSKEVEAAECTHLVLGPKDGRYSARYRLHVSGNCAVMDYTPFRPYNERRGMALGAMKFEFEDARRTHVQKLWWAGHRVLGSATVRTVSAQPLSTTGELVAAAQRKLASVLMRPDQAKFRVLLDSIYGARCCITGCGVEWALEAAHVSAYSKSLSNKGRNGILLRRDLHCLFDSGHLAIEPITRKVHFSRDAQEWPEYAAMHGTAVLAAPQPGQREHAIPDVALIERWQKFAERCGDQIGPIV